MQVILASPDQELRRMCAEVLAERTEHCNLIVAEPQSVPPGGDLYILDFQAEHPIPDYVVCQPAWRQLFVVRPRDLGLFQQRKPFADPAVLLKPVARGTLSAFLGQVLAVCAGSTSSALAPMRSDCDELLQCLIHTNLKLQEYDQERTNFLARAVHDIRAPLTALTGYCGLLLAEPLGPLNDDQKEVLRRMQHSAKRLSRMASAMFQLSIRGQVESHPNFEQGDLQECLDQAVHEIVPLIEEKHIEISVDLDIPRAQLLFDRSQMEQVFLNLLDNACKFTPARGSIEIKGYSYFWDRRSLQAGIQDDTERRIRDSRKPNSFRLDICDSGPGIPKEHLDSIFEQYTRYAGTQDRTGGGLGLAICQMILSGHHGRVWAESSESGARFSLVIPFCSAKPREQIQNCSVAVG